MWTVACQAPLSMEFSSWKYWSGLPSHTPRYSWPGIEPRSSPLQADSSLSEPPRKPKYRFLKIKNYQSYYKINFWILTLTSEWYGVKLNFLKCWFVVMYFIRINLSSATIVLCLVAQSCLTLCNPMDCSSPGSSIHGISQARMMEWVAIFFCRGSLWPRDRTCISYMCRWIIYHCTSWKAPKSGSLWRQIPGHYPQVMLMF